MKRFVVGVTLLAGCLFWVGEVGATSQFSRKEGMTCASCHLGFPRLNEFGEKYMRAGYKIPGAESVRKGEKFSLEKVSDWFGVRLNVDAVKWEEEASPADDTITFGEDKWTQFFVAGNIADRWSFFTEIQITTKSTHHSWWKLGYHANNEKFNVTVGNQSPIDHSAFSNRLRILPAVKSELYGLKTSTDGADPNGDGNSIESVNASSARAGIQVFGDVGQFVYYAGISNTRGNVADAINGWGGLRWYFPTEGTLAGSSVSATYYSGSDVDRVTGLGLSQYENDFSWWMPAVNIRAGGFDLQAYGRFVSEDNTTLVLPPTPETSEDWDGWGLTAGWMINDTWQPAIQYDKIDRSEFPLPSPSSPWLESEWITVALSYFPLENMRIAAYYRMDEEINDNDQFFVNLRMMF